MKYHLLVLAGLMGVLFLQGCSLTLDTPQGEAIETVGTAIQISNAIKLFGG